jgi:hypothetical protein
MGTGLSPRHETLLHLGVELDFQIGDLEIAANREGLQYKDITRNAITKALEIVSTEISNIFTGKIASATCLWDACRLYADNFEKLGTYQRQTLRHVISGKITWQGKPITTGRFDVTVDKADEINGIRVTQLTKRDYGRSRLATHPGPEYAYASVKTTLCINDLPKQNLPPLRVRGFFEANPGMQNLCVFHFPDAKRQAAWWKKKSLEGAPTILFSSVVPAVASVSVSGSSGPSVHRAKHSAKAFTLNEKTTVSYSLAKSLYWETTTVDYEDDEGVYVVLDKFRVKTPVSVIQVYHNNLEDPAEFLPQVRILRRAGFIMGPVYGFKQGKVPKLGKKWVPFEVAVKTSLDKIIVKAAQGVSNYLAVRAHANLLSLDSQGKFPSGSVMWKYLDMLNTASTGVSSHIIELLHTGSGRPWIEKPTLPKSTLDLVAAPKNVLMTYPLLALLPPVALQGSSDRALKSISEYVRLIGK